jgi:MFS family permease
MESKEDPECSPTIETVEDHSKTVNLAGKDRAAEFLSNASERVVVSEADNKRILRKIDLMVLPIMLGAYFLQQLDKSALSYSSVFGLVKDAHLVGEDYSWLGSIIYVAQLVMQPLVAYFLVKLPTGKFAGGMILSWGIVLSCMSQAKNFKGLMAARFFLGGFEAAIAPTFVAITQMWWRRSEQTNRTALWYGMNGVTTMLGSLLAWGLAHIHSDKLYSYQVIFLFCGLLTVCYSALVFIFLPDSPIDAKFFTEHDKLLSVERLRANQMGVVSNVWKWDHAKEVALDPKTYCWFALIFSVSIPSGGITTFGPLIISSFGFDSFHTILLNIPFGAVQIISILGGAWFATWTKRKNLTLALLCVPTIAGVIMLLVIKHTTANRGPLLVGYYLISMYAGITPLIYAWSAQNTAGETKKKATTAVLFIGQSAGNIIGPHLYTTSEAPLYHRGLVSNLALFIILLVFIGLTTIYLMFRNRQHAVRREELGKSAIIIDRSMMTARERAADNGAVAEEVEGYGGEKAFDDITDLKNEDFVYIY